LRDSLCDAGKIGIAKVVIKTRQHLAAIKPQGDGLVLELMHFPDELVDLSEFRTPQAKAANKAELNMARQLIDSMSAKWNPDNYKDDYREALQRMVEEKIEQGDQTPKKHTRRKKPANVIDLVSVLRQSIKETQNHGSGKNGRTKTSRKAA
jgi:DNA end-binding protein Ku